MKKTENNKLWLEVAESLKSIAHPTRIAILQMLHLAKSKELCVKEIHNALGLKQPETSRHLSILKNSQVLCCEKSGANSYYSLNADNPVVSGILHCLFNQRQK